MHNEYKKQFSSIYSRYYNYFKINFSVDLTLDILKDIEFTVENPNKDDLKLSILDFILEMSTEIYKINNKQDRKQKGQYPTVDKRIIRNINNAVLSNSDKEIHDLKILDPCCGTGNFILTFIYDQFQLEENIESILSILDNYVGIEIDSLLIKFHKIHLNLMLKALIVNKHSYSDFNIIQADFTKKSDVCEKLENVNILKSEKFDVIIGNPPYVALYGRRGIKKTELLREYYLSNYEFIPSTVKNGKLNLTMFFIEQSIKICQNNGIISFVIDISFFETAFEFIRKFILENTTIVSVITEINSFKDVASGQIILTLKNTSPNPITSLFLISDIENSEVKYFSQSEWMNSPNYRLVMIDEKDNNLISKIEKKSKQLVDLYPKKSLRTNTMLLTYEDIFVKKEVEDDVPIFPYFKGSKSLTKKFDKMSYDKFLHYDKELQDRINLELKVELEKQGIKNKKRIMLGDIDRHFSPKIYIRQSAKEIIASIYEAPSTSNNSLYSLCVNDGEIFLGDTNSTLHSVCAQLNSNITTYYSLKLKIIRIANGKQPQIKLSDLRKIRLIDNQEVNYSLDKIYQRIMSDSISLEVGITEIDNIIADYYQLSTDELEYIKNEISLF
ncbi:Eco57I restriction-modification methylase domain-containing protein [Lactococcus formosensis]|uniref:Eco57I restriction-modification methylase domain-containing protein n=1 Tax=Lactococcus formosensis TaxID=1281486 RepID=UPI001BCCA322|nr:N-6 DNA methylase [Lactococcus formosensis]